MYKQQLWASGYGQDEYGYFAEFSVSTGPRYWESVTQRMRWIPPGTFLMGAALGETPSFDPELQHQVTLSRGYWLADTACSQELWTAVMGENPSLLTSLLKGDLRPVVQVSFNDVAWFLDQLAKLVQGLYPALPTEAQWEYACRAGTTTPFSFGNTITSEQVNFDGYFPYGTSPISEYRGGTMDVNALLPNPWGLHQMHGNVWEWCTDWHAAYSSQPQVDPTGPAEGSERVIRGGSWNSVARDVRSACRHWDRSVEWEINVGFRLLSSVQSDSPGK